MIRFFLFFILSYGNLISFLTTPFKKQKLKFLLRKRIHAKFNKNIAVCEISPQKLDFIFEGETKENYQSAPFFLYEIASFTKFFIAHLSLLLESEKELDLDIPINHFLSGISVPSYNKIKITCRHLLLFQSGLSDPAPASVSDENKKPLSEYTKEDLYLYLENFVLKSSPGSFPSSYSNIEYGLLGHIIETKMGSSLEDLIFKKILKPLNLCRTFFQVPQEYKYLILQGSSAGLPVPAWNISFLKGLSGLISCPNDLAIYFQSIFFRNHFNNFIVFSLLFPVVETTKENLKFSFGMGIIKNEKESIWVVSGQSPGFRCYVTYDPLLSKAYLVMNDSSSSDNLAFLCISQKLPTYSFPSPRKINPFTYERLCGDYICFSESKPINCKVSLVLGGLELISKGEKPVLIIPITKKLFFCPSISHSDFRAVFLDCSQNIKNMILKDKSTSLCFTKIRERNE